MSPTTPSRLKHAEFHGCIGMARTAITPPVGIYSRTWGSARHDVAEGVHRPALASCLVFKTLDGQSELVFIALDSCCADDGEIAAIRAAILDRFGLKPEQLMLHPSHSHSLPVLTRRTADRAGGGLLTSYLDGLAPICFDLIEQARAALAEGTVSWAYGRCGLAFNRDAVDPASGRDICGLNLSEKADDTLLVGRISDTTGRIRATIVNYACHPVSLGGGNRLLSPDYIGAMREIVERDTGGAICVFMHGASGELTPRRSYEAKIEVADQNGRELGYAALSVLSGMFPAGQQLQYQGVEESGTPLGIWRLTSRSDVSAQLSSRFVTTQFPLLPFPSREELQAQLAATTERYAIERLERSLARRAQVGDGPNGDFHFTVWRLGEAFLVSTPAECYSQFQLDLRRQFPGTTVAVLNLSDGTTTYLPKPESFGRDVYQARIAFYQPDALARVTGMACEAISEMQ
ncbi:MAG TPA: hypothetical protein VMO78_06970 [Rhizomicrobium sp.]|nr:hypothetical protein [Rhizomicrobium sp.]